MASDLSEFDASASCIMMLDTAMMRDLKPVGGQGEVKARCGAAAAGAGVDMWGDEEAVAGVGTGGGEWHDAGAWAWAVGGVDKRLAAARGTGCSCWCAGAVCSKDVPPGAAWM